MKRWMILLCTMLVLSACDESHQMGGDMPAMQHGVSMQQLQMLIDDGLLMAVYGANMKLAGNEQGSLLMSSATGLVRRAMSGPEMAMMHKGGQEHAPMMKYTHDMGDTAFDMIGQMMLQSAERADEAAALHRLNDILAMAASGNRMAMSGQSDGQGRALLDQAALLLAAVEGSDDYTRMVRQMIGVLGLDHHAAAAKQ